MLKRLKMLSALNIFVTRGRQCGVDEATGGFIVSGGLHQRQKVLGSSNHSLWSGQAQRAHESCPGEQGEGHSGSYTVTFFACLFLLFCTSHLNQNGACTGRRYWKTWRESLGFRAPQEYRRSSFQGTSWNLRMNWRDSRASWAWGRKRGRWDKLI